jgi:fatty acid amide hydrolase
MCSLWPAAENAPSSLKNLRVGFYVNDGFFPPAQAVKRGVEKSVAALREAGAEVEEFQPPELEEALRIYFSLFLADGMTWMRQQIKGSKADWRIRRLLLGSQVPGVFRTPIKILNRLFGQRHLAQMASWCTKRTFAPAEYEQLLNDQTSCRRRFIQQFHARQFDAILCPPNALPALRHGAFCNSFTGSYALLYNLLGVPAGVVPVTRVTDRDQSSRGWSWDLVLRSARAAEGGSDGLPIGVQVVSAPGQEQTAFAIMALLEQMS